MLFGTLFMIASVLLLYNSKDGAIQSSWIAGWALMILAYIEINHSAIKRKIKDISDGKK